MALGGTATRTLQARFTGDVSGLAKSAATSKGLIGKLAKLTVGAGLVAAGGLLKVGKTFDEMTDTIVVGTGASGKALERLRKSALNVGKTTPASFQDIGTAIADVNTRLGLTGKPLERMSSKFLELSRITGTDLQGNIKTVSRVFGDWGIQSKDQSRALDVLFAASQKTGIGVDKLSQSVVQFGAPLRQMGFSFEESVALFGKWEKEGVNLEAVMSGMRMGLGKLSKAGEDPVKAFNRISAEIKNAGSAGKANKLAIETFGQRAGPDMAAAIREGRFEIGDLVKQLKNSGGALDAAGKGTQDFAEVWRIFMNNVMVKVEPIATRMFAALTTGMIWLNTTGAPALERFAAALGEKLQPYMKQFGDFVRGTVLPVLISLGSFLTGTVVPGVGRFSDFLSRNTAILKAAAVAVGALVVVTKLHTAAMAVQARGGMIAFLTNYVKGIRVVQAVTKVWTAVQWALNVALRANPIGIVITILTALGAALVAAYKRSDTFRRVVNTAWSVVKKVVVTYWKILWNTVFIPWRLAYKGAEAAVRFFAKHAKSIWSGLQKAVRTYWRIMWNTVFIPWRVAYKIAATAVRTMVGLVRRHWGSMRDALRAVWGFIKRNVIDRYIAAGRGLARAAGNMRDRAVSAWRSMRDRVRAVYRSIKSRAVDPLRRAFSLVRDRALTVKNKVVEIFNGLRRGVANAFSRIKDAITGPLRSVFNWIDRNVINKINAVLGLFDVKIPSINFGEGGRGGGGGSGVQAFAKGGVVPGTGNRDSVAAMLTPGEGIITKDRTRELGGRSAIDRLNGKGGLGDLVPDFLSDWVSDRFDDIKGVPGAIKDQLGSWLKKGVGFTLEKILSPAVGTIAGMVPAGFLRDFMRGAWTYVTKKAKAWGENKDDVVKNTMPAPGGGGPGGKVAVSGWAKPIGAGYRIGRGSAAHGYLAQDLPAPTGTPVYAMNNGHVSSALDLTYSYGRHLIVAHPGTVGVYAHLSRRLVGADVQVRSGQRIGLVGTTGNSTGPHLHLETRGYDPLSFLRARGVTFDHGGWVPPGINVIHNRTGRPERLLNADDVSPSVQVRVFIGDRELTDMVRVEIGKADKRASSDLYGRGVH